MAPHTLGRVVGDPPPPLPPAWQPALAAVRAARVTIVMGASDAGKTTLVGALARLLAREEGVEVVDADLGQSEIGPPGSVGLGHVRDPEAALDAAEVRALAFVGVTTPAQDVKEAVAATARMVARARREGFERVLVDTGGLIAGGLGRALKSAKIAAVDPDLVLCLQRSDECEPILARYAGPPRPAILRLPALGSRSGRSAVARRLRRQRALAAYFGSARPLSLDLERVALRGPAPARLGPPPPGARGEVEAALVGALAGLEDADGETIAVGVVQRLDVTRRRLDVLAPVPAGAVAAVCIGRMRRESG
jgi:polynucleotide 5'-hydroxyl-kinase GRC3/NOL9